MFKKNQSLFLSVFMAVIAIFLIAGCESSGSDDDTIIADGDMGETSDESSTQTCPPGMHWDATKQECVAGEDKNCPPGMKWDDQLGECAPDTIKPVEDGDKEDKETEKDTTPSVDGDVDQAELEPEEEKEFGSEYDETVLEPLKMEDFNNECGTSTPTYGSEITLEYDDGTYAGAFFANKNNDEAVHFIAKSPLRIKTVKMFFTGAGDVAIRITRDMARSRPDLDILLAPEKIITITEDQAKKWVDIDFSSDNILIHPRDHFWVVYRHITPEPYLGVATKTAGGHSMFRSDDLIEEWKKQGSAFIWAGAEDSFMVKVIAEPFCVVDTPWFTDISDSTMVAYEEVVDGDETEAESNEEEVETELEDEESTESRIFSIIVPDGDLDLATEVDVQEIEIELEEEVVELEEEAVELDPEIEETIDVDLSELESVDADAVEVDIAELDVENADIPELEEIAELIENLDGDFEIIPENDSELEFELDADNPILPTKPLGEYKESRLAVADLNNDGWQDLILHTTTNQLNGIRILMHNGKDGFYDYTEESGLKGYYTVLAAIADLNNDGHVDLYGGVYTNQDDETKQEEKDVIFMNDGSGHFAVLPNAGVAEESTTSAAGFADYNRDGYLDLYVGNWLEKYPQPASMPDKFFKGKGDGTFTELTGDDFSTTNSLVPGRATYGVTWCDWNNDGWMDILVANYGYDSNFLWKNNAGVNFTDVGFTTGLSRDSIGYNGGNTFGIDCGDYNNDGTMDAYLAEIAHPRYQPWSDPSRLLKNEGSANEFKFADETQAAGFYYDEGEIDPTWIDFDNDGFLDIYISSLYSLHYGRLYRNNGDGTFEDITYKAGLDIHDAVGSNWFDFDHDGDLDLLAARRGSGAHLHLFKNDLGNKKHWVQIRLEGGMKADSSRGVASNRSAIGARITVVTGNVSQIREVKGGKGHFNMQPSLTQHFGLNDATTIDSIKVRWPNGNEETYTNLSADKFYYAIEGSGNMVVDPLISQ